jgi:hypothetical protein
MLKLRAQLNIMVRSNAFSPQTEDNGDENGDEYPMV